MKKIQLIFNLHNLWFEFALGALMIISFAALGYFAREFALDLQANFFNTDWGSL